MSVGVIEAPQRRKRSSKAKLTSISENQRHITTFYSKNQTTCVLLVFVTSTASREEER